MEMRLRAGIRGGGRRETAVALLDVSVSCAQVVRPFGLGDLVPGPNSTMNGAWVEMEHMAGSIFF